MNLSHGRTIREPVGTRSGYWAGAPGVFFEPGEKTWYLTYRLRRPRGVQPDRGGEARIARSTDLTNWEDIWSVNKSEYQSASIERSAIHLGPDKIWRYFTSYVDPADGRWCVAVVRGTDPARLDAASAENIFKAAPLELEGIKDPWIMQHEGVFHMFLSVAVATPKTSDKSHSTLDIYNTGECISATGLAVSYDLDHWQWKGVVFKPEAKGWDCYCRRINCVVPMDGRFVAFYDGSASHAENYEEKTGIAVSNNLLRWSSASPGGPVYISPHGSHSLRYIDAQVDGHNAFVFYENARSDGAHDLRLLTMPEKQFRASLSRLLPG